MTAKDAFLLQVLEEAWDCCDSNEIEEGLMGAGGITEDQVKEFYPDWNDSDDQQGVVENVMKDVSKLLERLRTEASKL